MKALKCITLGVRDPTMIMHAQTTEVTSDTIKRAGLIYFVQNTSQCCTVIKSVLQTYTGMVSPNLQLGQEHSALTIATLRLRFIAGL